MSVIQAVGCVSAAYTVLVVSFLGFTVGNGAASTDCITESEFKYHTLDCSRVCMEKSKSIYVVIIDGAKLCVGRAKLAEVGQNTSLSVLLDEQEIR